MAISRPVRRPGRPKSEKPNPIDVQVGSRVRLRRNMLGLSQEKLGESIGLTFQQVQKYEGGANRVSASRLSQIADVLGVPISYFFSDIDLAGGDPNGSELEARERMQRPDVIDLIRSYYAIGDARIRHQFLDMVKAVAQSHQSPA
jgi:transcriptional regulator with XRE-family HTH domain